MTDILRLLGNASDGVFAIDDEQRVIMWSAKAEAILGLKETDVLGRPCWDVFDGRNEWGEYVCRPDCATFACAVKGEPLALEDIFVPRGDTSQVRINLSVIAIPPAAGSARAAILFRENGLRPPEPLPLESLSGEASTATPGSLAPLEVRCFGKFQVHLDGRPVSGPPLARPKVQTLLKLLVTRRDKVVPREVLIDLLWPEADAEAGQRNLKVLVHTLRRTLGDNAMVIDRQGDGYLLRSNQGAWLDVDCFLGHLREGAKLETRGLLARAMAEYQAAEAIYQGDFLADDLYEDWCAGERQQLKELCLSLLTKMASLYAAAGQFRSAAQHCQKALAHDNCRESVYRDLMRYLWWAGQGAEAVRQYQTCQHVLEQELGIGPLPETTRLYRHIVADVRAAQARR